MSNVTPFQREGFFQYLQQAEARIRYEKGRKYAGLHGNSGEEYNTLGHFQKLADKNKTTPAKMCWILLQKSLDALDWHINNPDHSMNTLVEILEYAADLRNYAGYLALIRSDEAYAAEESAIQNTTGEQPCPAPSNPTSQSNPTTSSSEGETTPPHTRITGTTPLSSSGYSHLSPTSMSPTLIPTDPADASTSSAPSSDFGSKEAVNQEP